MGVLMQLSICYFLLWIPFQPFHWFSKTGTSFAGMEKVLSPSQCRLPYLACEDYGLSKSCNSPGHRCHRIQQKDFLVWTRSQSENKYPQATLQY